MTNRLEFAGNFARRMLIVAVLFGAIIGFVFPALHFAWAWHDFHRTTAFFSEDFARRARETIRENPALWFYSIDKFTEFLDAAGQRPAVAAIRVYDSNHVLRSVEVVNEAIKITQPFEAPVRDNNEVQGYLEIVFDIEPLLADSLMLTGIFLVLGIVAGGFLYSYPLRFVRLAEQAVKSHAEEARQQAENEVARLERLSLIGQMAAAIGHEVRNPLTTVKGYLQLFARRQENAASAGQYSLMIEELDRANHIISEFLSLAHNKAIKKAVCNLNAIVEALYPLINSDAVLQDMAVCLTLSPVPAIFADEKEIRQLILNITRNGLEAMEKGGRLSVMTFVDGDDVVLAIADQGKGIDPALIPKLGTPFVTTKESGTGLGLAVCYSIAHRQGASITFATSPEGTTCTVRFPPADRAAAPRQEETGQP